jgi:hypothetical protein
MKTTARLMAVAALVGAWLSPAETLENSRVRLTIDAGARLTELTNVATGLNYAAGKPVWAMFYREGDAMENRVAVESSTARVTRRGDTLVIRYEQVQGRGGALMVQVEMEARLEGDEVRWSAKLASQDARVTITEFHFPLVGACRYQPGQALIWSNSGGQRFEDPRARIRRANTSYNTSDQNGIKLFGSYPGLTAGVNAFVFAGTGEGLYFGSHDPTFQQTLHLATLKGDDVTAGFVKYPFVDRGGSWQVTGYVLSPYSGDWHVAAHKYRAWANSWFKPVRKPEWVRQMTGWQRVIFKHQYGEILHPYTEMPQIAADGLASGTQSLLVFGWWKAGMDHDYPNYICDESQGGCAALKKQIGLAQAKGARIQLYFNGDFIDPESEYCRKQGCPESVKDLRGNSPHLDVLFSGDGTLTQAHLRKTLLWACPAAKEWREKLHGFADKAIGMGVDAVFYDSLGSNDILCADPKHGHPVPFTRITAVRAELFRELREYIKSKGQDIGVGTEIPTDIVAQHADFVHNITGVGDLLPAAAGVKPKTENFLEWFRYIYPEIILSERAIYEDRDVERRVNRALMLGLVSDVDVWRCRGTIRDTPVYREYLTRANALRTKYRRFILSGEYRDTELFESSSKQVEARSFRSGDQIAVVVTQNHLAKAITQVSVPGYAVAEHGGLGAYSASASGSGAQIELAKNALAIVVFAKK